MLTLFAQVLHLAAEGEEPPEGIDLVIPEMNELIAGIIAFSIVFLAIWIWARPAIARAIAARQDAITGQLQHAEATKVEAESLLEDYRKQLAEARGEANRIVDDARSSAERVRAEIVARAENEAAEIARRAREEAAAERSRAESQIRDEVAALSLALAQKVVAESVDASAQRTLVDRYIDDLGSLS